MSFVLCLQLGIPLPIYVALGGSPHKGPFLVTEPSLDPESPQGRGKGCGFENLSLVAWCLLLWPSEEVRLRSHISGAPTKTDLVMPHPREGPRGMIFSDPHDFWRRKPEFTERNALPRTQGWGRMSPGLMSPFSGEFYRHRG